MTFIIALQTTDSLILSADNTILSLSKGETIKNEGSTVNKIICFYQQILTGTGEYAIINRMQKYLSLSTDISALPGYLSNEKHQRTREIGGHEQIDNTRLIVSSNTPQGPRLYVIESLSFDEIQPGEILMFFPLDYDFLTPSTKVIDELNLSLREFSTFDSTEEWCNFYINKFSKIYAIQHKNNKMISRSFNICFQTNQQIKMTFVLNHNGF